MIGKQYSDSRCEQLCPRHISASSHHTASLTQARSAGDSALEVRATESYSALPNGPRRGRFPQPDGR